MTQRLNYFTTVPAAMDILLTQEHYLKEQFETSHTLSITILALVKLRVSQINQCAYCIDMHSKEAIAQGESTERLIGLSAWRGIPLYNDIERCALEWAELMTRTQSVSQHDFAKARIVFSDRDLVNLTIAVNAINSWNKMTKAFNPSLF
ncbi:carboxymuconolactone decarboxylase family protein [Pseudoalteromonas sp. JBTF-M23]|uniref:Carboxymuconolactone decarboxylase family protein n=1 Tax=Pseudoalteromonas caenipelagi TaxID=2726988 RepID=A0A849VHJ6_9GAMM|nr:carboxymuconolactone decarboxylase family protein [Pseudoalteromonas caenipelagi]NOU52178.1 carboxymuconolactone decarboxylase family protein [Pseudoalteromonas caenipelagi]